MEPGKDSVAQDVPNESEQQKPTDEPETAKEETHEDEERAAEEAQDEQAVQEIKQFLLPYKIWISRTQEVFFFRRPRVLNVALPIIYLTVAFIYTQGLGVYATALLFLLIAYVTSVFFCYADHRFVEYFFPANLRELDRSAPNRTRSLDEICVMILKLWKLVKENKRRLTTVNRAVVASCALACTFLMRRVRTFWVNFVLLQLLMYGPWLVTMPHKQFKAKIEQEKTSERSDTPVIE